VSQLLQKYDTETGEQILVKEGTLVCEVDSTNIGTIAVDDVVYILSNGKIIKAIANNGFVNLQLGIVVAIDGVNYTVQIDGIVTHSQTLANDLSKEVYVSSNNFSSNLADKLDVPFFEDDTAVIVGKKISSTKIKLSPDFYIFSEQEPNFVNDATAMAHFPMTETDGYGDIVGGLNTTHYRADGTIGVPSFANNMFGTVNSAIEFGPNKSGLTQIANDATMISRLKMGTDSITVSYFAKILPAANLQVVFRATALAGGQGYGVGLQAASEKARIELYGTTNGRQIFLPVTATLLINWHYNVVVFDRANCVVNYYVDGFLYSSGTLLDPAVVSLSGVGSIGNYSSTVLTWQLLGYMSNLRVYRAAWTAQQAARYWKYCNSHQVAL
jgi:hypothetical protein